MGQALIGSALRVLHTPSDPFHNIESAFLRDRADRVTDLTAAKHRLDPHKPQNLTTFCKKGSLGEVADCACRGAREGSLDIL